MRRLFTVTDGTVDSQLLEIIGESPTAGIQGYPLSLTGCR